MTINHQLKEAMEHHRDVVRGLLENDNPSSLECWLAVNSVNFVERTEREINGLISADTEELRRAVYGMAVQTDYKSLQEKVKRGWGSVAVNLCSRIKHYSADENIPLPEGFLWLEEEANRLVLEDQIRHDFSHALKTGNFSALNPSERYIEVLEQKQVVELCMRECLATVKLYYDAKDYHRAMRAANTGEEWVRKEGFELPEDIINLREEMELELRIKPQK